MSQDISITKGHAVRFLLAYQHLLPPRNLKGKKGIVEYIQKVGCIQFDPLDIVGRNPELVLQSRIGDFSRQQLTDLLYSDRQLIDGWDKLMSIYHVKDWPFFATSRDRYKKYYSGPNREANSVVPKVRKALRERGPLSSIDLDFDQQVDWHWAPTRIARAALESMYFWGELIIHHKVHTRKIYDLAERHIPSTLLKARNPFTTDEELLEWHVARRISGIGLLWERSGDGWLGIQNLKAPERRRVLATLEKRGEIVPVRVDDISQKFYIPAEAEGLLLDIGLNGVSADRASVIAPLDNLLWDRKMISALFGFEYVWEVYKPLQDRLYGYYVLPVLYRDRFVARFEPKRDKATGAFVVHDWWWEQGIRQSERMKAAIRSCLNRLRRIAGASSLVVGESAIKRSDVSWITDP